MITTKNKAVYEEDICGFKAKARSVVFPESIEEIKTVIRTSNADIIPRGAGTSFTGAVVPNDSVVMDMSKMKKIIEIDPSRKIAYVEAGVILDDLNYELGKYGLELPVHPVFSQLQTIGGAIALNSSGSRELKYGKIKNWLESLEVVNGKSECITVSRSDTSDFCGMEGLTGVIVRAKLRLTTKKTRTFTVLKSDSFQELLDATRTIKLDHEVSIVDMLGKTISSFLGLESKYHLIIEYESNKGNLKNGAYAHFLNLRNSAYPVLASKGFTLIEDPKLFTDRLADFLRYLEQHNVPYWCNLGSGVVYACFKPEEQGKRLHAFEIIKKYRARPSYGLGIGLTKKHLLDRTEKELVKRIKTRHDPNWKFNKNKMIDYEPPSEFLQKLQHENQMKQEKQEKQGQTEQEQIAEQEIELEESIDLASEEDIEKSRDEQIEGQEKIKEQEEIEGQEKIEEQEIKPELQTEESKELTEAELEMEEFIEEQKINDILSARPIPKTSPEEQRKIEKIAKEIMQGAHKSANLSQEEIPENSEEIKEDMREENQEEKKKENTGEIKNE